MASIIEVRPERTTPKGRTVAPRYLFRFDYPALLSGERVQVTTTQVASDAMAFVDPSLLESALELLRSLGYDPTVREV